MFFVVVFPIVKERAFIDLIALMLDIKPSEDL
jgi:hypothetical protein